MRGILVAATVAAAAAALAAPMARADDTWALAHPPTVYGSGEYYASYMLVRARPALYKNLSAVLGWATRDRSHFYIGIAEPMRLADARRRIAAIVGRSTHSAYGTRRVMRRVRLTRAAWAHASVVAAHAAAEAAAAEVGATVVSHTCLADSGLPGKPDVLRLASTVTDEQMAALDAQLAPYRDVLDVERLSPPAPQPPGTVDAGVGDARDAPCAPWGQRWGGLGQFGPTAQRRAYLGDVMGRVAPALVRLRWGAPLVVGTQGLRYDLGVAAPMTLGHARAVLRRLVRRSTHTRADAARVVAAVHLYRAPWSRALAERAQAAALRAVTELGLRPKVEDAGCHVDSDGAQRVYVLFAPSARDDELAAVTDRLAPYRPTTVVARRYDNPMHPADRARLTCPFSGYVGTVRQPAAGARERTARRRPQTFGIT